jgi:hypothetical protein
MAGPPILKQFGDLALSDFERYPVWASVHMLDYGEPWYKASDEETFRPWTGPLPVRPDQGMFLVRATLTLIDGRVFRGFITPQHQGEELNLGTVQPHLFLASGWWCSFWDGMLKRPDEKRREIYADLGQDPARIFPIGFYVDDGLATGRTSGSIPGFCWCPKDKVQVYY